MRFGSRTARAVAAWLALSGSASGCGGEEAGGSSPTGCASDADCKGDRICQDGVCVDDTGAGAGSTNGAGGAGSGGAGTAGAGALCGAELLHDGPHDQPIPGWSHDEPRPVVIMTQLGLGSGEWSTLSGGTIGPDGRFTSNSFAVAEPFRIVVWGWTGGDACAPVKIYDGPIDGGEVTGWVGAQPYAFITMAALSDGSGWFRLFQGAGLAGDGTVIPYIQSSPRILFWGWPGSHPATFDLAIATKVAAWTPEPPRPVVALQDYQDVTSIPGYWGPAEGSFTIDARGAVDYQYAHVSNLLLWVW